MVLTTASALHRTKQQTSTTLTQGALGGFSKVCEAIVSWHALHCEGLANELVQIMCLYKQRLESVGQWEGYFNQLEPAVRDKLTRMCGL
jgi:hypothetical protein